jgi:hypothetical protein
MAEELSASVTIKAKDEASPALKEIKSSAEGTSESLGEIGKVAAGIALGGLVNVVGSDLAGAMETAASKAETFGASVFSLQSQTGATAQVASQLIDVFDQYGVSSDDAAKSMGILSKGLAYLEDPSNKALTAGKQVGDALSSMGISATDAAGQMRPMNDVMLDVADRFASMPDGADKTALSMVLFGRAGKDLIPVLDQGGAAMKDAMDQATKYGLVLSQDNVDALRKVALEHKSLDEAVGGLELQFSLLFLPVLDQVTNAAIALANAFTTYVVPLFEPLQATVEETASSVGELVGSFMEMVNDSEGLHDLLNGVGNALGDMKDAVMGAADALGLTEPILLGVKAAFAAVAAVLVGAALGPVIAALGATIAGFGTAVLAALSPVILPIAAIALAVAGLKYAWDHDLGGIQETAARVFGAVQDIFGSVVTTFQALVAAFTGDAGAMGIVYDMIRHVFGDTIADYVQPFLQTFMDAIPDIQRFAEDVEGFVLTLGQVISSVFSGDIQGAIELLKENFEENGADIVTLLSQWAGAFLGWIEPMIPPLLAQLADLLGQFAGWLLNTALPAIVAQLSAWAGAFIAWVAPLIPPFLAEVGKLLSAFGEWLLNTALPAIVDKLGQWAGAFIAWIQPLIKPFLDEIGKLLLAFTEWLLGTALPAIVGHLASWAGAFISWIAPLIPPFLLEMGKLLIGLTGWVVTTAVPVIVESLLTWAGAFLGWVATSVVPQLGATMQAILGALGDWITGTALPWIETNVPQIGESLISALVGAIGSGTGAIGDAILNAVKGAVPGVLSGIAGVFGGGQGGAGVSTQGGALTVPQTQAALEAAGLSPQLVADACGPIAAQGIAKAFGMQASLASVVGTAEAAGDYAPGVGTYGPGAEMDLLRRLGINSHIGSVGDAESGAVTAISTPNHYFLSQGYDPNSGTFDVGNTGTAFRAGAPNMTLAQIQALGGGAATFISPTGQGGALSGDDLADNGITATSQAVTVMAATVTTAANTATMTLADFARASGTSLGTLRADIEASGLTAQQWLAQQMPTDTTDAQGAVATFAQQTGVSLAQANTILNDHGAVAKAVLGTGIPGQFAETDLAVERFAAAFGLTWAQARTALEAGGTTSQIVMGTLIPTAAQQTTAAVTATGAAHTALVNPISAVKTAAASLATDGLKVATDAATQISFVLQQLNDKMPALIANVQVFGAALANLPRDVTTTITTNHVDTYSEQHDDSVGHNALGTDFWGGGLTWVGERGPEIVNLPRGAQVIPNDRAGGSIDYDRLGAAVARAMQALSITVDGAAIGRVARTDQRRYDLANVPAGVGGF